MYNGKSSAGQYSVQLMVEDFPRQTQTNKRKALSSIPLHLSLTGETDTHKLFHAVFSLLMGLFQGKMNQVNSAGLFSITIHTGLYDVAVLFSLDLRHPGIDLSSALEKYDFNTVVSNG